jgi:hypothetical protein
MAFPNPMPALPKLSAPEPFVTRACPLVPSAAGSVRV